MIIRARAPLRLGLAGGGTDVSPYCDLYGGCVMNATIDKYAHVTVLESTSGLVELVSLDQGIEQCFPPGEVDASQPGTRLLAGTYRRICADYLAGERPPLRMLSQSDAPPGSGLGSSSTMVVALVTALAEYFSLALGEYEIARLAYEIERVDLALAGGKQDQYAAAFGGFNFMEFEGDRAIVNPLRVKDWIVAELEASILLYFTGVSRESARIIDEQSRNASAGEKRPVDAMHSLKREAVLMKEAVLKGDLATFANTLQAGWEAKKRMASSISNPGIDAVESAARRNGALATKVSGAGGGGFMMFCCDPVDRVRLAAALRSQGGSVLDFHFNPHGATAWRAK